jgi:RNA polymerase sigma-70 factor (ECF subfamily)
VLITRLVSSAVRKAQPVDRSPRHKDVEQAERRPVKEQWRDLFADAYPRLAGWARKLVGDDDAAHEIASEAFTRLMGRWSKVDDPNAYLYKIAANLVTDHWRRAARDQRTLQAVTADRRGDLPGRHPGESWEINDLLRTLPDRLRQPVMLHYLAGFSIHDVSQMLGRPEGTIKSDLHRARVQLRHQLDPSHD